VPIPSSTYRLQVQREFTLYDAAALTGYLADLGVGSVYLSPLLQSTIGSDHGYDTTDVTQLDHDRGGEEGLRELQSAARAAGLGLVIDIVPNHLGISAPPENPAWWDVLRRGQDSEYARWFDIDWSRGRILVPILGDDTTLRIQDGELRYFEHRFPLAPGSWEQGDEPETVHGRQHYQLVHYSRGNSELNYRRFFAITTLAGVRQEDPAVFDATHSQVQRLIDAGIDGLRIDHPDGLVDPAGYLMRLRSIAPNAWIAVEKILETGEELPADWPVSGTTGYDAMREVNGVFVDPAQAAAFTDLYQRLSGDRRTLGEHVEAAKRMVVTELLPAEIRRMSALVPDIAEANAALAEVAVAFEVYRSYLPEGAEYLDRALNRAAERRPELRPVIDQLGPRLHDPRDELARRLQQLTGATMAKGVEDTAYYRYARFVALNEVGGDPDQFGIPLEEFHRLQTIRQDRAPDSMTSLSTHDTKRGEDVRARLAVLSELPDDWGRFAERFLTSTKIPNRAFGYFLAQSLVGTGPIERQRMHSYAEKAMREAADGTRWTAPDGAFEASVHEAVDAAYDERQLRGAWNELDALISGPGWSNALGQKLVQLTMPGVPDVYQGSEIWENSLVDPDNRRPVDFAARMALLGRVGDGRPTVDETGIAKLWITRQALRLRREHPEWFRSYRPVEGLGSARDHIVGFDRGGAITLATRLPVRLAATGSWGDTKLTLRRAYIDQLTGRFAQGDVLVADLLADYPVALLTAA
jgi:(1->4)-alpha-D-glucan 1-alpha-D-glucosylmutase